MTVPLSALLEPADICAHARGASVSRTTALRVGDKLTTGPNRRVSGSLSDGSQLELDDSSTLVLTENVLNPDGSRASTKVTQLNGPMRSLVKVSSGSPPNIEVHTPNAVAAARGTMFDVSYHEGQPPPVTPARNAAFTTTFI